MSRQTHIYQFPHNIIPMANPMTSYEVDVLVMKLRDELAAASTEVARIKAAQEIAVAAASKEAARIKAAQEIVVAAVSKEEGRVKEALKEAMALNPEVYKARVKSAPKTTAATTVVGKKAARGKKRSQLATVAQKKRLYAREQAKLTYNVEAIFAARKGSSGKVEYFVKWEGYPMAGNTWEPAKNFPKNNIKLKDFKAKMNLW